MPSTDAPPRQRTAETQTEHVYLALTGAYIRAGLSVCAIIRPSFVPWTVPRGTNPTTRLIIVGARGRRTR
ncbi:hypothetical protein DTO021D3_5512 [Paecilomyces variotii]|nr:hypothetical protein DTO032I3_8443 [Paecilomyces variotii]KAJ9277678.1 hypothetical protein DTO021D3_5512 [Paecilomyces variotii]KAJ9341938.1 hypothetical protein DTO027B6_5588 [Paecilomyces variotii]KAJ9389324.1 hypothetical protein DTO032I4_2349 [Paecilomyces variotii]